MTHPDLRTATTPREALVAAVEQLRRIADALTTPAPETWTEASTGIRWTRDHFGNAVPATPAASDDGLRDQLCDAIIGLQQENLRGGGSGLIAPGYIADAVLAVRDRRMEQLTAERETWKAKAAEIEADRYRLLRESPWLRASDEDRQTAEAKVARVLDLVTRTGLIDPAELRAALDTPAPRQPVYDAVRDGHHDLDYPDTSQ